VFVPSFGNAESCCQQEIASLQEKGEKHRRQRKSRRRGQRNKSQSHHHDGNKQHSVADSSKEGNGRKQKNQTRRGRRRRNEKRQDTNIEEEEEQQQHENLFPPLVSDDASKSKEQVNHRNTKDWLNVAESAHAQEEEERRKKVERLYEQASETVKLTPLLRSSTTTVSAVPMPLAEPNLDEGTDKKEIIKEQHHEPQHCVHVDMTKLRNRWWELVREKNLKDFEERQRKLEEKSTSSSSVSTESWEEEPVETIPPHVEPEHVPVDHTVLEACLESSYPFHRAIMEDDEKAIQLLLQQEGSEAWLASFVDSSQLGLMVSTNTADVTSFSPLMLAVHLDKPQLLVKALYDSSPVTACTDSHGRTALMLAAAMGFEGCIRVLRSCGASLLDKDDRGDTAIHYACKAGVASSAMRALLLSNGNRSGLLKILSCKNNKGQTPLHAACEYCHVHIVEVFLTVCNSSLLSKLLKIRDDANQTPLLAAVRAESTDIVMSLLMWRGNDQGGKFATDDLLDGDSCPLFYAASNGSADMVSLLLEFMDPLAQETSYNLDAALQAAVRSTAETRLDNMHVLVEAGANPCASSHTELGFPCTALNIACTKGDVAGLTIMLDSWESHITAKRIARRQDPKLRRQPESYFAAIEAKENVELKHAVTNALVLSLFLGFSDGDVTSPRLDASITLFDRGAQLNSSDFVVLKSSIHSGRLLSLAEASVHDGENWFATSYHHPISARSSESLDGYDRSPLRYWSQVLCSLPWMNKACSDTQCSWMVVHDSRPCNDVRRNEVPLEDQVVLIAEGERFVVNASLVSQKSAKLAAAIRFGTMNEESGNPLEVELAVSSRLCRWLLQHIYHGSIVSGWHTDPLQCATDLMELAVVAEEFLCPSLLRECEMRLLSADPFQCYCWSCCLCIRGMQSNVEGSSAPYGECLYRVQGPSRLLTADCVLDALAVSGELGSIGTITDSSIGCWNSCQKWKKEEHIWDLLDENHCSSGRAVPFVHAKDAAIQTCLGGFVKVSKSPTFLSQVGFLVSDGTSQNLHADNLTRQAQAVLLQTCLNEMSTSALLPTSQQSRTNFRVQSQQTADNTK